MQRNFCLILVAGVMLGCTSINVTPLDPDAGISRLCIEKNDRVDVPGFLEIVRAGFERHGIRSSVFSGSRPADCPAVLTYTALRSWDLATYMSHAELWVRDDQDVLIASAEYHLVGGGGFALTKFASTKSKMRAVFDELLKDYPRPEAK